MSNLSNQQINSSFNGILQIPGGVTSALQNVQDGNGNPTGLFLSTSGGNVSTSDTFIASVSGVAVTGGVSRLISDGLGDRLSVRDFGAIGDGVADDTNAIRAAISYANNSRMSGNGGIYGNGLYVGTTVTIFFPKGVYKITDYLTADTTQSTSYLQFAGERSIIVANAGVTIFGGIGYNVSFDNLIFREGAKAISIKTANVDTSHIDIQRCEFHEQTVSQISTDATSQSTLLTIDNCKLIQTQSTGMNLDLQSGDLVSVTNSWINANAINGAAIYNGAELVLENLICVPYTNSFATTGRWIDNYSRIRCRNVRFGGEYGGAPIVWNYVNLKSVTTYPWISEWIIIENCDVSCSTTPIRADAGIIVAKAGLPGLIKIVGCKGKVDSPYIFDGMTSGTLASYLQSYSAALGTGTIYPSLSIAVQSNESEIEYLCNSPSAVTELLRFTSFFEAGQINALQKLPSVVLKSQKGTDYSQTSSSGTTSIIDTQIFYNSPLVGYGSFSSYEVMISGNPNVAGSGSYYGIVFGYINIIGGISSGTKQIISFDQIFNKASTGVGSFTVTAVFWDGTTETTSVSPGSTSTQIRIKIDGYNPAYVGAAQVCTVLKRI